MKTFLVKYRFDGSEWNIEMPAASFEDARRRLSQLTFGQVEGEVIAKVPASLGIIASLAARIRNLTAGASR